MEETIWDVCWDVEVSGTEEIEENGEAIWVSVDEMIFSGRGRGRRREIPFVVEECAEEGIATCVCESR